MNRTDVGDRRLKVGELPSSMLAWVIHRDQHGSPQEAMRLEEVPVPLPGPNEVLVRVMAAGVNYNGVWAALGKPVSVFRFHDEPMHIAGSDAAGIVWQVGSQVRRWRPGDEVVIHCNQSCGECPECNGHDPLACEQQRIWGYETSGGAFAEFTRVQAQQLLPKPPHLSWEEAGSYGLTYFTAYRMLVDRARVRAGENVLIWGAAGGLGSMAIQIALLAGANPIAVVSSPEKAAFVRTLGAQHVIDRSGFGIVRRPTETAEQVKARNAEIRRFGAAIRELTGGADPDVVFEHIGAETFPTSVFVCKRFGRIVICGATSGFNLDVDARYLWMRQKSILGSHFANAYEAAEANKLVVQGKIRPVVGASFDFQETPRAHQVMLENAHVGKLVVRVCADEASSQSAA